MTELRLEQLSIRTAPLGQDNPLPPVFTALDARVVEDPSAAADEEMRAGFGYGRVGSVLPYLVQDDYDRALAPMDHTVAVLENDHLRATFLVGLGGRLWSLVDKSTGRELLHRNQILQPANFALRGAWFAGGVEWNIGTIGHSPTTYEPLHAARVELPDGTPALRMWEFERLREVVFQVDAWLPEDSRVLLVRVRIVNPNDHVVPMYWWTNIAVPESADTRVLVAADRAWLFDYDGALGDVDVPLAPDGRDLTYPARAGVANDYFFDTRPSSVARPWIAAIDEAGAGLFQASTARLRGRKLFVWGTGRGGRNWQDWLSGPGSAYLEIQAGLARTQLEHLPMPAGAAWSWVEAYGLLTLDAEVDAARGHGDWAAATASAETAIGEAIGVDLDAVLAEAENWADAPPSAHLSRGSGWGRLETLLRGADGDHSLALPGTPFSDADLTTEQEDWLALLRTGRMPEGDLTDAPRGHQRSLRWLTRFPSAPNWRELLLRGVLHAANDDEPRAIADWDDSLRVAPNAWASRNLAAAARARGEHRVAVELLRAALSVRPGDPHLTRELAEALIGQNEPAQAVELLRLAPAALRDSGRGRLLRIQALLGSGCLSQATAALAQGLTVADLREGEPALHDAWFEAQAAMIARSEGRVVADDDRARARKRGLLPTALDLRMTVNG